LWKAAGEMSDPIAKAIAERDDLAAQLRRRDAEIAALTGRLERMQPRIESMTKELVELRKSFPGVCAESAIARIEAAYTKCVALDARIQHLERGRHCDA
jgi:chromosome segregation ATPase